MFGTLCLRRRFGLLLAALILCLVVPSTVGSAKPEGDPVNVVVLSFGNRDPASLAQFIDAFRAGVEQEGAPLHIFLETLDEYGEMNDPSLEKAMEQYLSVKYEKRDIDLAVAIGNRSLDFLLPRRNKLFPQAKLLYTTVIREPVPNATGVMLQFNLLPTIEVALQQNPDTKRLLLITGSSSADQAGVNELVGALEEKFRHQTRPMEIIILPPMTYEDTRKYLSRLPGGTVCIFLTYYMDSAGQIFTPSRVVPVFSRVSTRPIYAGWDIDVGRGGVGGRVIVIKDIGHALGLLAARVLRGEDPGQIPPIQGEFQRYLFDWKQMERWGLRLDQLPSDSTVLNREYTAWELYKWYIMGAIVLILGQTGLILFLFELRAIKQRAQKELANTVEQLHALSGRLIQAQEEERSRLARELHDDVSQRLALLAIELEGLGLQQAEEAPEVTRELELLWIRTKGIGDDIHRLSRQLHPSQLELLGLVAAIRSLCAELNGQKSLHIEFIHKDVPRTLPAEVTLCFYRIVQEALQNVRKHSGTGRATVELTGSPEGLNLSIADDGVGFEPGLLKGSGGLGLVSMRERVHLVSGNLLIRSRPGQGTRVEVRVPLSPAPL